MTDKFQDKSQVIEAELTPQDEEFLKEINQQILTFLEKDEEILEFEKSLHKRYILGFNDCRHYVNRFTGWCLSNPTPIWKLHRVWNENDNENENAIENFEK